MPTACVLLVDGFEEIEAITVIDVLRRADVETTIVIVGVDTCRPRGSHGIRVEADEPLVAAARRRFDLVVLPGGMPGATNLRDHEGVQQLVRAQSDRGGHVAAICAAPIALASAGVLAGRKATSFPGFAPQLPGVEYLEQRVVHDGHVTTSRSAGTAMEFALALVERLRGPEVAAQVGERMLVESR
jgi:4-methyl-5(b-hydroxyethyl)-thiazole monophosphate biosynthesis